MDDISVVGAIAAIVLAGYFLFKMTARADKIEQVSLEKVEAMQTEMHSMADTITEMLATLKDKQAQINELKHDSNKFEVENAQASVEIDNIQEHMIRLSKSVLNLDHMPKKVEMVISKPIPVRLMRTPLRKKKTVTKKTTVRTKNGSKSISESNTVPLKGGVNSFRKVKKKRSKKKATKKKYSARSRAN